MKEQTVNQKKMVEVFKENFSEVDSGTTYYLKDYEVVGLYQEKFYEEVNLSCFYADEDGEGFWVDVLVAWSSWGFKDDDNHFRVTFEKTGRDYYLY